jgi:hypothetical protein
MQDTIDLIKKYNITDRDLYALAFIEERKPQAGFLEKEKLKGKSMGILKPYNVKFMDIGVLLDQIKKGQFHNDLHLKEKYGEVDLGSTASSSGLKYTVPIFIVIAVFIFFGFKLFSGSKPSKCDCVKAYEDYLFEGKSVSKWSDCVHGYKSDVNDYLNKSGRSLIPDNSGSFGGAWESGAYDYFKNNCK